MALRYERSCGCIIENDGQVLLIRGRKSGVWSIPKGHVEPGESDTETAMREVREEVGLDPEILPGGPYTLRYQKNGEIDKTVLLFPASVKGRDFTIQQSEVSEARWCSFSEALRILRSDEWRDALRGYMRDRGIEGERESL